MKLFDINNILVCSTVLPSTGLYIKFVLLNLMSTDDSTVK